MVCLNGGFGFRSGFKDLAGFGFLFGFQHPWPTNGLSVCNQWAYADNHRDAVDQLLIIDDYITNPKVIQGST